MLHNAFVLKSSALYKKTIGIIYICWRTSLLNFLISTCAFLFCQAIVQISVEFAQQTEMARINKHACQASTSMQTQSCEEEMEEQESEEQTPRDSFSPGAWLEEMEREKMEKELEERNAEIQRLKEELQRAAGAAEKVWSHVRCQKMNYIFYIYVNNEWVWFYKCSPFYSTVS